MKSMFAGNIPKVGNIIEVAIPHSPGFHSVFETTVLMRETLKTECITAEITRAIITLNSAPIGYDTRLLLTETGWRITKLNNEEMIRVSVSF